MGGICKLSYDVSVQRTLKDIPKVSTFEEILNKSTLNELDKEIFRLHYLEEKDFAFIADKLGYSESGIRKRHSKALKKLSKII